MAIAETRIKRFIVLTILTTGRVEIVDLFPLALPSDFKASTNRMVRVNLCICGILGVGRTWTAAVFVGFCWQ